MSAPNRNPLGLSAKLLALFGGPVQRRMAKWGRLVALIGDLEPTLQQESDQALRKRSLSLRFRAKSGERLDRLLPEAYALVREAAVRTIGLRHFDVADHGRHRAVQAATSPKWKRAKARRSRPRCRCTCSRWSAKAPIWPPSTTTWPPATPNDMGPIYRMLGLTVGVIQTPDSQDERRKAYACDITYGTAKEFGFDFLRDRLLLRRMGRTAGRFPGRRQQRALGRCPANSPCSAELTSPWSTRPTAC